MGDYPLNDDEKVGTKLNCDDGKSYVIVDNMKTITKDGIEYQLGFDVTNEPEYAIIGTYSKDGKTYACVHNDPVILGQLLGYFEDNPEVKPRESDHCKQSNTKP